MKVQYPITAGQIVACYSASSVNDTNWHNLNSSDFYDSATGTQLDADLTFAFVSAVSSNTTTTSHLQLRSADPSDGKTNADGVFEIHSTFSLDVQAMDGGQSVTTVAYAKASGSEKFTVYAGFNK